MARPDLSGQSLVTQLAGMERRLRQREQRANAWDFQTSLANATGLPAYPVPLLLPDAYGKFTLTGSLVDTALFLSAPYSSFWVLVAADGPDLAAELHYPADDSRVLAVSENIEEHPISAVQYIYRLGFSEESALQETTNLYETTVVLACSTLNPSTTWVRIIGAAWGESSV